MVSKVLLKVLSGPIKGKIFEFSRHDAFILGRGKDCHAKLEKDTRVSRHHFLLEVNPPHATLRDLGSLNGTYVNGGRRHAGADTDTPPAQDCQVRLSNGDRIVVGRTQVLVRIHPTSSQVAVQQNVEQPACDAGTAKRLYTPTTTEANLEERPVAAGKADHAAQGEVEAAAADKQAKNGVRVLPHVAAGEIGGIRNLIQQAVGHHGDKDGTLEVEGYKLEKVVGRGGMGSVYRARRVTDDFPVAVKVMVPKVGASDKSRHRFLKEIDVIRELTHPNITTLIESGVTGKAFYFVFDYCNGGSLADLVFRRGGKLSSKALHPIMLQCLAGLEYAHRRGFVHRDLKPGNILLHQQGTGWLAKVADFGLAKQFEQAGFSGMTLTGAFGGTYDFMPREQLTDFKNTKPVSDVWSLGATFYRALTGTSPREYPNGRDPMGVVLQERAVPIRERDPSVPPALAAVLDKALAYDAEDRFQNASEMNHAFKGLSS
jgi:pSer/pThr/pTyr-binding forkhead associated (FHA) protein